MPDPLLLLSLDAIDPEALPRDRTALCPEALAELRASILASGLRQQVEVFEVAPEGWLLRFTGRDATCPLMESVLEETERLSSP
jgi:hypothetical protein